MFADQDLPQTDVAGAKQLLADGYQLVDVRTQEEWDAGHVAQARHLPLDQLPERAGEVTDRTVLMCKSGGRSGQATAYLRAQGRDVVNLDGGITAWQEAGEPVSRD